METSACTCLEPYHPSTLVLWWWYHAQHSPAPARISDEVHAIQILQMNLEARMITTAMQVTAFAFLSLLSLNDIFNSEGIRQTYVLQGCITPVPHP